MELFIFLATLFFFLAFGIPICLVLVICAIALMLHADFFDPIIIATTMLDGANNYPRMAIPFFVFAGEIMAAAEAGLDFLKFFPAEQAGGAAFLKSLASPFGGIHFCPTGGIGANNAKDYLGLPNVICVGGSWVAPDEMVKAGDWAGIEALAREASKLRKK